MKKISFCLPVLRFDESDALATRQALNKALQISDDMTNEMIRDAKMHGQLVVNFRVQPEQFAEFLILRNDFGGKNWFADMKPRVLNNESHIVNKRIVDFTSGLHPDGYKIHDDMPQRWVDEQNERRAERAVYTQGRSKYDSRNWTGAGAGDPGEVSPFIDRSRFSDRKGLVKMYSIPAGETSGPYDVVFGTDGRVKSSKFRVEVRHWRSGTISLKFDQSPATTKSAAETGMMIHEIITELDAKHSAQIKPLMVLLNRATSILTHGVRLFQGRTKFMGSGPATFLRHAENLINDAKEYLS